MRPIASTWVSSMQNIAAPDSARLLMWVKCQSVATPSSAEYWHIGDTRTRFFKLRPRSLIGENRALMRESSGAWEGDGGSVVSGYGIASHATGMGDHGGMHCGDGGLLHQRELQQQSALEHREIVIRDHRQHRLAVGRDVGVDAFRVVDLVAEIGVEQHGAVDQRAGRDRLQL